MEERSRLEKNLRGAVVKWPQETASLSKCERILKVFTEFPMLLARPSFVSLARCASTSAGLPLFSLSTFIVSNGSLSAVILIHNGPLLRQEAAASAIIINTCPEFMGLPS